MIYETEALILNRYPYGDTSIICNLFTRDYGRLSVISKGARKLKNINSAILRPLQFIDLNYYYRPKRNIQLLKEATINKHFFQTHNNYKKIVSSYQIIDIMNQICKIENPNEIIFRLVKRTMKKINLCESNKIILYKIFFKLQLFKYIGYQPMIESCEICGDKLENVLFDWSIGQLICTKCKTKNSNINFSSKHLNIIKYFSNTHINNIDQLDVKDKKYLHEIDKYLLYFLSFHIINVKYLKSINFQT